MRSRSTLALLVVLLFASTFRPHAQAIVLFEDDFLDNSNDWSFFEDNYGESEIDDGFYVFDFDSRSDMNEQFMVPFGSSFSQMFLYAPYIIDMEVSDGECTAGSCMFRLIVGYNEDRITYIEYDYSDAYLWLHSGNLGGRILTTAPIDSTTVRGDGLINIFDGASHTIGATVAQNQVLFRIDGESVGTLSVGNFEASSYQPTGKIGFSMAVESYGGEAELSIDSITVTGSARSLEPSPTPIPPTAIPTPIASDAGSQGFAYEQINLIDVNFLNGIEISQDGSQIAFVTTGGVSVIDESGETVNLAPTAMQSVASAAFSPMTNTLAIGGIDRREMYGQAVIEVFNLETGESAGWVNGVDLFTPEEGGVVDIAITPNYIAGLTASGLLKFWDNTGYVGSIAHIIPTITTYGVIAFDVNEDGTYIVTGGSDDRLSIWSPTSFEEPLFNRSTTFSVSTVQFRPNSNQFLFTSCDDRNCTTGTRVYDAETESEVFALDRALFGAAYSSDGRYILGLNDASLALFDAEDGSYLGSLPVFEGLTVYDTSWITFGPVQNGSLLFYSQICTDNGLISCDGYDVLIGRVELP